MKPLGSPASPATPVTPTVLGAAGIEALASTRFLTDRLGNATLAKMATCLDRALGGNWAFTGSVALNIHAVHLEGKKARDFEDADIQIKNASYAAFMLKLGTEPSLSERFVAPAPDSGDAHYRFGDMLVDFVDAKTGKKGLPSESEYVAGLSVLTLRSLRQHKSADASDGTTDHGRKARADLEIINRLIAKSPASSRPTPSGRDVPDARTIPNPFLQRRRP